MPKRNTVLLPKIQRLIATLGGNIMSTYVNKNSEFTWKSSCIYGSSQVAVVETNMLLVDNSGTPVSSTLTTDKVVFYRGKKRYELSNHLGNVLAVITDRRIQDCDVAGVNYYKAQVVSVSDYYPFGMGIKEREYVAVSAAGGKDSTFSYRFGFNGMEQDNEVQGQGNSYTTEYRMLDVRLCRWLSTDPLANKYPDYSPYQTFNNNPLYFVDPSGLEGEGQSEGEGDKPKEKSFSSVPVGAEITKLATGGSVNVKGTDTPAKIEAGSPQEFTLEGKLYTARFNTESGEFTKFAFKQNVVKASANNGQPVKNALNEHPTAISLSGFGLTLGGEALSLMSYEKSIGLQNKGFWVATNGNQYQAGRSINGTFAKGFRNPGQGGLINSMKLPVSSATRTLGKGAGVLKFGGNIVGGALLVNDYHNYSEQNEYAPTKPRLTYHTFAFLLPIAIGAEFGGPVGALAGGGFLIAELGHDYILTPAAKNLSIMNYKWTRALNQGAIPNRSWLSDSTLKDNITVIDSSVLKLSKLNAYNYTWKSDSENALDIGLLAQEVEGVFPELVVEEDGLKKVKYIQLIAVLVDATKEQQIAIDLLQESIHKQEELIEQQRILIQQLLDKNNAH